MFLKYCDETIRTTSKPKWFIEDSFSDDITSKLSADSLRFGSNQPQFRSLLSSRRKMSAIPLSNANVNVSRESLLQKVHFASYESLESLASKFEFPMAINVNLAIPENEAAETDQISIDISENIKCSSRDVRKLVKFRSGRHQTDDSAVKVVYRKRSEYFKKRVEINYRCLMLAMIGIVTMVVDSELTGQQVFGISKMHTASISLRALTGISTIFLLYETVQYHMNEFRLALFDCGAQDWRVIFSIGRFLQLLSELVICAICPLPGTGYVKWTFIPSPGSHSSITQLENPIFYEEVPVDVILSLLMLFRVYLFTRFMVLTSKQFQDASTRTLAALNRIKVNFSFVLKSIIDQHPITFLTSFTIIYWITTSWAFVQCERYGRKESPSIIYYNAFWFTAITFMLNGYGDIVPQTHCGRVVSIAVGVVGAILSSILIAVISKKIYLTQGQQNVNNFMNDSRLINEHKQAAARILQQTWQIYNFRHVKNKIRLFNEQCNELPRDLYRVMNDLHGAVARMAAVQEEMRDCVMDLLQKSRDNPIFIEPH